KALTLAEGSSARGFDERLTAAADRLGLDSLDSAILAVCVGPELDPRLGRLYGYLHDNVTRQLASPRLASELLAGDGVERADVLGRFGVHSRLLPLGAIRLLPPEGAAPLVDRPVKVADRLAALVLAAGGGMSETDAPARLRRIAAETEAGGREESVREVA